MRSEPSTSNWLPTPETVAGPLGTGTANLQVMYAGAAVSDTNPADNSSTFDITAVAAE